MTNNSLDLIVENLNSDSAIIFLHGFSGEAQDTWGKFPDFAGENLQQYSIAMLGFSSSMWPDFTGIWSADPDLPNTAKWFQTQLNMQPLSRFRKLSIIAHSMGGLVAQKALVDSNELRARTKHLILFGTPSNGLKKAWWARGWKRQLDNMSLGSDFITKLRTDWNARCGQTPPFDFRVVAGSDDQFVPETSSLAPFPEEFQFVVRGDHLNIVKPREVTSDSFRLVATALDNITKPPAESREELHSEFQQANRAAIDRVTAAGREASEKAVVEAVLELDGRGARAEALAMIEEHLRANPGWTDLLGVHGGRLKRIWLDSAEESEGNRTPEQDAIGQSALEKYKTALDISQARDDHGQIYYHAINVAFLELVMNEDRAQAAKFASLALTHCQDETDKEYWNYATQAEANLYLRNFGLALSNFEEALKHLGGALWKLGSSKLNAGHIALRLGDSQLQEDLDAFFSPELAELEQAER